MTGRSQISIRDHPVAGAYCSPPFHSRVSWSISLSLSGPELLEIRIIPAKQVYRDLNRWHALELRPARKLVCIRPVPHDLWIRNGKRRSLPPIANPLAEAEFPFLICAQLPDGRRFARRRTTLKPPRRRETEDSG
jgi:hypothetical protein